uniref:omptin family outer membrane protease n=1 Tax=Escherichia coli TaxID=562 RepID=UPI0024915BF1
TITYLSDIGCLEIQGASLVYVEGAWNRVTNKKGNTSLYDHNDNTSDYSKNGAGIENYNFITTAGLKYTF